MAEKTTLRPMPPLGSAEWLVEHQLRNFDAARALTGPVAENAQQRIDAFLEAIPTGA
tara:strand:- start:390 stop:560 length:171 start_codon:yes stop_codon:yes gene_type:complete